MKMNNLCKLNFALEHIAHLEDYINEDWNPSLIEPLNRMKVELEKQEKLGNDINKQVRYKDNQTKIE